MTAEAIASDPFLSFAPDTSGRWTVREREGSATYSPAMDQRETTSSDIAYVGRLTYRDSNLLVIAALHALGSLGAVDYLTRQLGEIYRVVGTKRFSMVVRSEHDGERVVRSELVCPPRVHA